jgi:hypothetical protein
MNILPPAPSSPRASSSDETFIGSDNTDIVVDSSEKESDSEDEEELLSSDAWPGARRAFVSDATSLEAKTCKLQSLLDRSVSPLQTWKKPRTSSRGLSAVI